MHIPERFMLRLVPTRDGCLVWKGAKDRKGYAVVKFEGRRCRLNRVLYKLRTGRWPRSDHEMLHNCDNPPCCAEGKHVFPGTRATNARQRQERGRTRGAKTYA